MNEIFNKLKNIFGPFLKQKIFFHRNATLSGTFYGFLVVAVRPCMDSLHARLNSYYEAWSSKKKKITKIITGYRKSV